LWHHAQFQNRRHPDRRCAARIVDELIRAAAKFCSPLLIVDGRADEPSMPVADLLIDCAVQTLQRVYPLRRTAHQSRQTRRHQLHLRHRRLAGTRLISSGADWWSDADRFFLLEPLPYRLMMPERADAPKPECQWHSRRWAND